MRFQKTKRNPCKIPHFILFGQVFESYTTYQSLKYKNMSTENLLPTRSDQKDQRIVRKCKNMYEILYGTGNHSHQFKTHDPAGNRRQRKSMVHKQWYQ